MDKYAFKVALNNLLFSFHPYTQLFNFHTHIHNKVLYKIGIKIYGVLNMISLFHIRTFQH